MSHRLLVVDDEEPILFAMREYFTSLGFQVDCVREIEPAQALLAEERYQVVIADLRLAGSGGREGLELVSYVRRRHPGTAIVVLTAYGSPEVESEARSRGIDAFLHKPSPLREVAEIVQKLADGRHGPERSL